MMKQASRPRKPLKKRFAVLFILLTLLLPALIIAACMSASVIFGIISIVLLTPLLFVIIRCIWRKTRLITGELNAKDLACFAAGRLAKEGNQHALCMPRRRDFDPDILADTYPINTITIKGMTAAQTHHKGAKTGLIVTNKPHQAANISPPPNIKADIAAKPHKKAAAGDSKPRTKEEVNLASTSNVALFDIAYFEDE